ncbi:MAG: carboxypeptidase-like regulatory domain-containing protein [Candidatus Hydrogenedentota bacterium]
MKRLIFYFFLILACFFISGCGTGIISGIIIDDELKPLEGAILYTDPPSHSVSTNPDGQYVIRNIPIGKYTVSCKKEGYKESSVDINVYVDQVSACDLQLRKEKKKYY